MSVFVTFCVRCIVACVASCLFQGKCSGAGTDCKIWDAKRIMGSIDEERVVCFGFVIGERFSDVKERHTCYRGDGTCVALVYAAN